MLKRKLYHDGKIDNIKSVKTKVLNNLKEQNSKNYYHEWQNRSRRCVHSQGAYFEGDNVKV